MRTISRWRRPTRTSCARRSISAGGRSAASTAAAPAAACTSRPMAARPGRKVTNGIPTGDLGRIAVDIYRAARTPSTFSSKRRVAAVAAALVKAKKRPAGAQVVAAVVAVVRAVPDEARAEPVGAPARRWLPEPDGSLPIGRRRRVVASGERGQSAADVLQPDRHRSRQPRSRLLRRRRHADVDRRRTHRSKPTRRSRFTTTSMRSGSIRRTAITS